jgi:outer membrane receptor protein involved in Fe transport
MDRSAPRVLTVRSGRWRHGCARRRDHPLLDRWRHHARVGWVTPWNMDFSLTWRYYGSVSTFRGNPEAIDHELSDQNYFDLTANWNINDKTSVMLGINNVMDEDPPATSAVGTTGNGNTFPQTYDALGRWVFLRAQVGF